MRRIRNLLVFLYLRHVRGIVTPRQLLAFARQRLGARTVLVAGDRTFTFAGLDDAACRLANALLAAGMTRQQTLAVWLRNSPEFIIARLAAYKAGFVFSALVDDFDFATAAEILPEVECRAFIFDQRVGAAELLELKRRLPDAIFISVSPQAPVGAQPLDAFVAGTSVQTPAVPVSATDMAAIGFTSGTTGRSKGVVWENRAWLWSFYHLLLNNEAKGGGRPQVFLHTLPFSTAGSLGILPGLCSGGLNVILPEFSATAALDAIQSHRVTRMITVPVFLVDIWDAYVAGGRKYELSSLETINVGSAPLAAAKWEAMVREFGPVVEQGYGMSEVLAPIARIRVVDPERQAHLLRSVGRVIPEVRLRIMNPDAGGRGTIALRSPTCATGYWKQPELTRVSFRDGWFYSNDIGRLDGAGNLYILDRTGYVIEQGGGRRVFPREIEECLHQAPGVKECAVVQEDDRIVAYVSPRRGVMLAAQEIEAFCAERLVKEERPDKVVVLEALPRSTSGKILKRNLQNRV